MGTRFKLSKLLAGLSFSQCAQYTGGEEKKEQGEREGKKMRKEGGGVGATVQDAESAY